MRIAICFSGQIRTGVAAAANIINYIGNLMPVCDIFMHTWNIESYSSQGFSSPTYENMALGPNEDLGIDYAAYLKLLEIYRPVMSSFEDIEFWRNNTYLGYGDPMLYSVYVANSLKCQYEKNHQFEYDYVIRTRFDLILAGSCLEQDILEVVDPRTFCFSQLFDAPVIVQNIDNAFWIGSSYVINQLSNFIELRSNCHPNVIHDTHMHIGKLITDGFCFHLKQLKNTKSAIYRQYHIDLEIPAWDFDAVYNSSSYQTAKDIIQQRQQALEAESIEEDKGEHAADI